MGIQVRLEHATILGDWGTTNLRLWLVGADGGVLDAVTSEDGANVTTEAFGGDVFGRLTHRWCQTTAPSLAILCGMVGRKGGWIETPYLPTDRWSALSANLAQRAYGNMDIFVVPGLRTLESDDVMRGEETQILGFLDGSPDFTGTICLPGTHSKWCQLSCGKIAGFQTEMTGELFELLSKNSVLRDAITEGLCEDAFASGVEEGLNVPDTMRHLFSIRANWLLKNTKPEVGFSRLSGLLIGAEVARATRNKVGEKVAIIGSSSLTKLYEHALDQAGISSTVNSGDDLVIQGLQRIAQETREMIDG